MAPFEFFFKDLRAIHVGILGHRRSKIHIFKECDESAFLSEKPK
jgi:hypothetical protein